MSETLEKAHASLTAKEVLHRAQTVNNAERFLENLPDDIEAHRRARNELLSQVEHYQRMAGGIMAVVDRDLKRFS